MKGKIIVIEGACDGIGKSTQFNLLKEELQKNGEVITHHFPSYNTNQGYGIECYLKGELGKVNDLSPYFINNLYAYDRAITWNTFLKKEYESGKTILFDRYTTSSIIYQSSLIEDETKRKEFINFVLDYEYNKLQIGKPDQVIFLNAPFDLVTNLRENRKGNEGIDSDIHEQNLDFMKKVYENSQFVSKYLNWDIVDCNIGDKFDSIDNIHKRIMSIIKK